jgi:hypothetical protein
MESAENSKTSKYPPTSQSGSLPSSNKNSLKKRNLSRNDVLDDLKASLPKMNRGLRKFILKKYPCLKKLFYCTSKYQLRNILFELSHDFKVLLKKYMQQCFILHLHVRPISNINELLKQRRVIYEAISNPNILNGNKSFANNLIKNFCKGLVNFIVIFYNDLVQKGLLKSSEMTN